MTLFSLSAIRDTWKTKELINDDSAELCGMVPIVHSLDLDTSAPNMHPKLYLTMMMKTTTVFPNGTNISVG